MSGVISIALLASIRCRQRLTSPPTSSSRTGPVPFCGERITGLMIPRRPQGEHAALPPASTLRAACLHELPRT